MGDLLTEINVRLGNVENLEYPEQADYEKSLSIFDLILETADRFGINKIAFLLYAINESQSRVGKGGNKNYEALIKKEIKLLNKKK